MSKKTQKAAVGSSGRTSTTSVRARDGRFLGTKLTTLEDIRRDTYGHGKAKSAH